MAIYRRRFIAQTTLAAAALVGPLPRVGIRSARAAGISYRMGHDLPATHPLHIRLEEACARIATRTQGEIKITVYPFSKLGSDLASLEMVKAGQLDFFTLPGIILSSKVQAASLNAVGFAFSSYGQIWPAMDGPLGAYIRGEIEKFGVVTVGRCMNNGFRQATTKSKPILKPADFEGVKLRVPPGPLTQSLFQSLGAIPTPLNFDLLYKALESETVDGQETPLALMMGSKLYEVQTYCSLTNHIWDGYWMLANDALWKGFAPKIRDILVEELDRAAVEERGDLAVLDPNLRGDAAMTGLKINPVDTLLFQRALQKAGFYKEWKSRFGDVAWKKLEDAADGLT